MSINEYEGILTSLEEIHKKLDKLLASGSNWSTKEHMKVDLENAEKIVTMSDEEFRKKEITTKEEVVMDLTEVQCVATTEKAILVTKKGYQKWVPLSQLSDDTKFIEKGDFLEAIELKEGSNWILKKPWDDFEVFKG